MQLPAKLLTQVRIGVGVGAVLLGGCDLVEDAKAQALGEPVATPVASELSDAEPSGEPTAEPTPEPMLLSRGVSGVVQDSIAKSESPGEPTPPLVADLGRAPIEEGPRGFVPYDGGLGAVASAPPTPIRPAIRSRPRPRPTVDEPCDPGLSVAVEPGPDREWQCLACGRG